MKGGLQTMICGGKCIRWCAPRKISLSDRTTLRAYHFVRKLAVALALIIIVAVFAHNNLRGCTARQSIVHARQHCVTIIVFAGTAGN